MRFSEINRKTAETDIKLTLSLDGEGKSKINAHNASFDYIAMEFRLRKGLGMSFGFMPYSNVGYTFGNRNTIGSNSDINASSSNRRNLSTLRSLRMATFQEFFSWCNGLVFIWRHFAHSVYNLRRHKHTKHSALLHNGYFELQTRLWYTVRDKIRKQESSNTRSHIFFGTRP